jgi:putative endonuclease
MRSNTAKGKTGEKIAAEYLLTKGYKILEFNWRFDHKEIDIIACTETEIVFVEVKARKNMAFGLPEEAVTAVKEKNLIEAAGYYIEQNDINLEARFDVITLINGKIDRHYTGAF